MALMALMAPKRAQEERNAVCELFTSYAPSLERTRAAKKFLQGYNSRRACEWPQPMNGWLTSIFYTATHGVRLPSPE